MRLIDLVQESPRRLVVPLMGYPGARLTNSTLKQNGFNSELHYRSIRALVERFEPDVAFFMMDLSIEAGAIGLPIRFPLNESASVESHPVQSVADLDAFRVLDPLRDARVRSYIETMQLMKENLKVLRGAYVIGPFTLAGLMMGAENIALATITDRELVTAVVEFSEDVITGYARALIQAGAEMIAILEPTATFLSPKSFKSFSGSYVGRIASGLDAMTILHICGNTTHLVPAMCETGVQGLSLDGPVDFPGIAKTVPPDVVLIGNVDPVKVMVNEGPKGVRKAVVGLMDAMAPYPNFVLSTGCDLPLETPLENIEAFVRTGKGWSQ
jgi:uroporphyrinogen decarboxylase